MTVHGVMTVGPYRPYFACEQAFGRILVFKTVITPLLTLVSNEFSKHYIAPYQLHIHNLDHLLKYQKTYSLPDPNYCQEALPLGHLRSQGL